MGYTKISASKISRYTVAGYTPIAITQQVFSKEDCIQLYNYYLELYSALMCSYIIHIEPVK